MVDGVFSKLGQQEVQSFNLVLSCCSKTTFGSLELYSVMVLLV